MFNTLRIQLNPTGLSCNNFLKGLHRGIDKWQEELKYSVIQDVISSDKSQNKLKQTIPKIFGLALAQSHPVQSANLFNLMDSI